MKNAWLFPLAVIRPHAQRMLFAGLCATGIVLSISCGGGSSAPTPAPPATAVAPAAQGAAVVVSSIVATTEYIPGTAPLSVAYWSTFTVKETGGASGATISTILMHIQNRTPPVTAAEKTYTVNEKITSSGSKTYTFGLFVDAASTTVLLNEVNFLVSYMGDNGVPGSFSTPASTRISAPTPIAATPAPTPTPTPSPAPANCFTANGNICMSMAGTVTVSCTDVIGNLGYAIASNCSANVPMNITTGIASGQITVKVVMGGGEDLRTTIVILPNTAPGQLTAQIPTARLSGGCNSTSTSHNVEVSDGPNPGGRLLFAGGVTSRSICR